MSALDEYLDIHIGEIPHTCLSLDGKKCNCGLDEAKQELTSLRTRIAELERECLHLAKELSPKHYCQPPEEK